MRQRRKMDGGARAQELPQHAAREVFVSLVHIIHAGCREFHFECTVNLYPIFPFLGKGACFGTRTSYAQMNF